MKLTSEQAQAIVGMQGNHDFKVFMSAVAIACSVNNEKLIKSPEANEYLRGQVFALSSLLESVNGAPRILERMTKPKT